MKYRDVERLLTELKETQRFIDKKEISEEKGFETKRFWRLFHGGDRRDYRIQCCQCAHTAFAGT